MEKINSAYEALFIVDMTPGEEAIKSAVEKFVGIIADHGTVTETSEWGKRRLAYPIKDMNEGYYVLVKFTAPADFPAELERLFGISDSIIRSMVTKQYE